MGPEYLGMRARVVAGSTSITMPLLFSHGHSCKWGGGGGRSHTCQVEPLQSKLNQYGRQNLVNNQDSNVTAVIPSAYLGSKTVFLKFLPMRPREMTLMRKPSNSSKGNLTNQMGTIPAR